MRTCIVVHEACVCFVVVLEGLLMFICFVAFLGLFLVVVFLFV